MTKVYLTIFLGVGENEVVGVYLKKEDAQDAIVEATRKWYYPSSEYGNKYHYYRVDEHELK